MEQYLQNAWQTANELYETLPPEVWGGIAAALLFLLLMVLVIRRRRRERRRESLLPAEQDAAAPGSREAGQAPAKGKTKPAPEETVRAPDQETPPAQVIPFPERGARPLSFMDRLKAGLSKTRHSFTSGLDRIFAGQRGISDELLEELEELLITSDVGVATSMDLIQAIAGNTQAVSTAEDVKAVLKQEIRNYLGTEAEKSPAEGAKPHVIMVVGVNGVGKTTTIGKLAARYTAEGKKVLLAAADTFRAAAGEQLTIWAERAAADIVRHKEHADPAAVAYDGVEAGMARGADIVLVDTAGRLHTKVNLMEEVKKVKRSIQKKMPDAPHEILLVLDATTGQNAISQARMFHEALDITGIALTKLDGTAKGGIVISICHELKIPLKYIGIGEKLDDLQHFDADHFVDALF